MMLTLAQITQARERHHQYNLGSDRRPDFVCDACDGPWPCDASQALDQAEAYVRLRERIAELAVEHEAEAHAVDLSFITNGYHKHEAKRLRALLEKPTT